MSVNQRMIIRSEAFEYDRAVADARETGQPAVGPWLITAIPVTTQPRWFGRSLAIAIAVAVIYVILRAGW